MQLAKIARESKKRFLRGLSAAGGAHQSVQSRPQYPAVQRERDAHKLFYFVPRIGLEDSPAGGEDGLGAAVALDRHMVAYIVEREALLSLFVH